MSNEFANGNATSNALGYVVRTQERAVAAVDRNTTGIWVAKDLPPATRAGAALGAAILMLYEDPAPTKN
jgi:hypothetical protein